MASRPPIKGFIGDLLKEAQLIELVRKRFIPSLAEIERYEAPFSFPEDETPIKEVTARKGRPRMHPTVPDYVPRNPPKH